MQVLEEVQQWTPLSYLQIYGFHMKTEFLYELNHHRPEKDLRRTGLLDFCKSRVEPGTKKWRWCILQATGG
jgi:hypothetical protein